MRRLARFSALLLLGGCFHGPAVTSFGPAGRHASLSTVAGQVSGELLAATDSSVILFEGERVSEVRFRSILSGEIDPGGARLRGQSAPTAATLSRLRQLSRFPQGLQPALLRRFLEENQVSAPVRQL
jgi:hypothetical protein